jgi:hypothetical protein
MQVKEQDTTKVEGVQVQRLLLGGEREILVPTMLLLPPADHPRAVVVGVAQGGKAGFLQDRATVIAALLSQQIAVCLPDVRGTGESSCDTIRGRSSAATDVASTELMLGQTLVGSQLKDLRSVLQYLRSRPELDAERIAIWGDSFAPAAADDEPFAVPHGIDAEPIPSEPAGHLLALLGGLFDEQVAAVASARGGLCSFDALLETPYVSLPYDALVPCALQVSELDDLAASLAPRPLWVGPLVDGVNHSATQSLADQCLQQTRANYLALGAQQQLQLHPAAFDESALADWISGVLRAR